MKVYAKDTTISGYTSLLEVIKDAAPAAPDPVTAKAASSSRIYLIWSGDGTNARTYEVQRAQSEAGRFTVIASHLTELPFSDSSLAPSATYYYKAITLNSAGQSASAITSATILAFASPAGVLSPRAASGDNRSTLTWSFQYDVQYKIGRSLSANGVYDTIADKLDAYTLRYVDSNKVNGTNYYYRIFAYNEAGLSEATTLMIQPMFGQYINVPFDDMAVSLAEDIWGGYHALFASSAVNRAEGDIGQAITLPVLMHPLVAVRTDSSAIGEDMTLNEMIEA